MASQNDIIRRALGHIAQRFTEGGPVSPEPELRSHESPWYDELAYKLTDMIYGDKANARQALGMKTLVGPDNPLNIPAQMTRGVNTAAEGYRRGDPAEMAFGIGEAGLAALPVAAAGRGALRSAAASSSPKAPGPWEPGGMEAYLADRPGPRVARPNPDDLRKDAPKRPTSADLNRDWDALQREVGEFYQSHHAPVSGERPGFNPYGSPVTEWADNIRRHAATNENIPGVSEYADDLVVRLQKEHARQEAARDANYNDYQAFDRVLAGPPGKKWDQHRYINDAEKFASPASWMSPRNAEESGAFSAIDTDVLTGILKREYGADPLDPPSIERAYQAFWADEHAKRAAGKVTIHEEVAEQNRIGNRNFFVDTLGVDPDRVGLEEAFKHSDAYFGKQREAIDSIKKEIFGRGRDPDVDEFGFLKPEVVGQVGAKAALATAGGMTAYDYAADTIHDAYLDMRQRKEAGNKQRNVAPSHGFADGGAVDEEQQLAALSPQGTMLEFGIPLALGAQERPAEVRPVERDQTIYQEDDAGTYYNRAGEIIGNKFQAEKREGEERQKALQALSWSDRPVSKAYSYLPEWLQPAAAIPTMMLAMPEIIAGAGKQWVDSRVPLPKEDDAAGNIGHAAARLAMIPWAVGEGLYHVGKDAGQKYAGDFDGSNPLTDAERARTMFDLTSLVPFATAATGAARMAGSEAARPLARAPSAIDDVRLPFRENDGAAALQQTYEMPRDYTQAEMDGMWPAPAALPDDGATPRPSLDFRDEQGWEASGPKQRFVSDGEEQFNLREERKRSSYDLRKPQEEVADQPLSDVDQLWADLNKEAADQGYPPVYRNDDVTVTDTSPMDIASNLEDAAQFEALRKERANSSFDLMEPQPLRETDVPGIAALEGAEKLAGPDGISLDYANALNKAKRPKLLNANPEESALVAAALSGSEAPKRAYHWTDRPEISENNKFAPYSHFGTAEAANDRFVAPAGRFSVADMERQAAEPGSVVQGATYPVDLNIQNPLRIRDAGTHTPLTMAYEVVHALDPLGELHETLPSLVQDVLYRQVDALTDAEVQKLGEAMEIDWYYKEFDVPPDDIDQMREWIKSDIEHLVEEEIRQSDDGGEMGEVLAMYGRKLDEVSGPEAKAIALDRINRELNAEGYDGLVYQNFTEGDGADSYIATKPGTVKSATTGETLFSNKEDAALIAAGLASDTSRKGIEDLRPALRSQLSNALDRARDVPLDERMAVLHNLTPENLDYAIRNYDGHLPVPSLGISRVDHPIQGFGDVTLVGPPSMAVPRPGNPVLRSDAYSSRRPTVEAKLTDGDVKKLDADLGQAFGAKSLTDVRMWTALEDVKEAIKKGDPVSRTPAVMARYLKESGREVPPGDPGQAYSAFREAVKDDPNYEPWAKGYLDRLGIKPVERIFKGFSNEGNRQYRPHTLDNIVKAMKTTRRDVAGSEGFNYGLGNLRAATTPEFRSIKQVQDERGRLAPKPTWEADADALTNQLFDLAEKFNTYDKSPFSPRDFGLGDRFSARVADIVRGRDRWSEYYRDLPPQLMDEMRAFLAKMRDLPTDYFEAKPQRAVKLNEFVAGLVPEDAPASVRKQLNQYGLEDIPYAKDAEGKGSERIPLLREMKPLLFANDKRAGVVGAAVAGADRPKNMRPFYGEDVGIKGRISPEAMDQYGEQVKSGLPGRPTEQGRFNQNVAALLQEGVAPKQTWTYYKKQILSRGGKKAPDMVAADKTFGANEVIAKGDLVRFLDERAPEMDVRHFNHRYDRDNWEGNAGVGVYGEPKWGEYSLDGGQNYDETAVGYAHDPVALEAPKNEVGAFMDKAHMDHRNLEGWTRGQDFAQWTDEQKATQADWEAKRGEFERLQLEIRKAGDPVDNQQSRLKTDENLRLAKEHREGRMSLAQAREALEMFDPEVPAKARYRALIAEADALDMPLRPSKPEGTVAHLDEVQPQRYERMRDHGVKSTAEEIARAKENFSRTSGEDVDARMEAVRFIQNHPEFDPEINPLTNPAWERFHNPSGRGFVSLIGASSKEIGTLLHDIYTTDNALPGGRGSLNEQAFSLGNKLHKTANARADASSKLVAAEKGVAPSPYTGSINDATDHLLKQKISEYAWRPKRPDRLSWSPGDEVAQQMGIQNKVESITVSSGGPNGARDVMIKLPNRGTIGVATVDNKGRVIRAKGNLDDPKIIGANLEDVVGKSVANRILSVDISDGVAVLRGDDLKLGGEGMRGYYGNTRSDGTIESEGIVGSRVKSILGRVGQTEFDPKALELGKGDSGLPALSFKLDDAALDKARDIGLPLYANNEKSIAAALAIAAEQSARKPKEIDAMGLFSPSLEAIKGIDQERGTVGQFKSMILDNGGKPKELEAIGFDRAFPDPNAKVTRGEVEAFLRQSRLELGDVRYGKADEARIREDLGDDIADYDIDDLPPELADERNFLAQSSGFAGEPRYEFYSTPGGENYRETVTTLPSKREAALKELEGQRADLFIEYEGSGLSGRQLVEAVHADPRYVANIKALDDWHNGPTGDYASSHWPGVTNPLLHHRTKDFINPDGSKTRVLDELQSDWAQRGRDGGFRGAAVDPGIVERAEIARAELNKARSEASKMLGEESDSGVLYERLRYAVEEEGDEGGAATDLKARWDHWDNEFLDLDNKIRAAKEGVPSGPYIANTSDWVDLGLRRALIEAAQNPSVTRFAWAPGDVQARRYGMERHSRSLRYEPKTNTFDAFNDDGNIVHSQTVTPEDLPNVIGADVANRLLATEPTESVHGALRHNLSLSEPLVLGGEGQKKFYGTLDNEGKLSQSIVGQRLMNLVKKIDPEAARVRPSQIDSNKSGWHVTPPEETTSGKWLVKSSDYNSNGLHFNTEAEAETALRQKLDAEAQNYPSIPLTPKLREHILREGMSLFANKDEAALPGIVAALDDGGEGGGGASGGWNIVQFTDEMNDAIRQLYPTTNIQGIADRIGVARATLDRHMQNNPDILGREKRVPGKSVRSEAAERVYEASGALQRVRNGESIERVAEDVGLHHNTLRRLLYRDGIAPRPAIPQRDRNAKMAAMLEEGKGVAEVAETFNLAEGSVKALIERERFRGNLPYPEKQPSPPRAAEKRPSTRKPSPLKLYSNNDEAALPAIAASVADGADLPMDLASRMARAKEMGFDTERTLYHGTSSDFDQFDPHRYMETFGNPGNGRPDSPMYFAKSPEYANYVADYKAERTGGAPSVMPVFLRDAKQWADRREVVVTDPRNIRSVNAAFDPAKSDSADLLAANRDEAGAAAFGPAMSEKDQKIERALRITGERYSKVRKKREDAH